MMSLDPLKRLSLLVCDGCGGVLAHDGTTTDVPFRSSLPDDLAPHYDTRGTLTSIARKSGWSLDAERVACARCSALPPAPV